MNSISPNGVLARVPGHCVARGSVALPEPSHATDDELEVMVDAEWAGIVVIRYRRRLARHGKHSHWYWHAVRADEAPALAIMPGLEPQKDQGPLAGGP